MSKQILFPFAFRASAFSPAIHTHTFNPKKNVDRDHRFFNWSVQKDTRFTLSAFTFSIILSLAFFSSSFSAFLKAMFLFYTIPTSFKGIRRDNVRKKLFVSYRFLSFSSAIRFVSIISFPARILSCNRSRDVTLGIFGDDKM